MSQLIGGHVGYRIIACHNIVTTPLVHKTRFWNNIHQVRSKSKYMKAKQLKDFVCKKKSKGSKQHSQHLLISHIHEEGEP